MEKKIQQAIALHPPGLGVLYDNERVISLGHCIALPVSMYFETGLTCITGEDFQKRFQRQPLGILCNLKTVLRYFERGLGKEEKLYAFGTEFREEKPPFRDIVVYPEYVSQDKVICRGKELTTKFYKEDYFLVGVGTL